MSIMPPGSDRKTSSHSERRADAEAIGCYYEFVTDVDDDDEDDTYHPRWSQLAEEDREGWRRVAAFVRRVETAAYEDGRAATGDTDPIETSLEACSAELAEVTRQRDDLLRRLRGNG